MNGWFVDLELGHEQVVRVKGDVDLLNSPELSAVLLRAIEKGSRVVADLSQAELLDSSALTVLSEAVSSANKAGVKIVLSGVNDTILRTLQIAGLASAFGLAEVKSEHHKPQKTSPDLSRQDWCITESVVLAEPEMIFHLRDLGVSAAQELGLDHKLVADIRLVLTEALTHALRCRSLEMDGGRVALRCMCCPKAFVMEITGAGNRDESDGASLIGFKLIEGLTDEVTVVSGKDGGRLRLLKWIKQR